MDGSSVVFIVYDVADNQYIDTIRIITDILSDYEIISILILNNQVKVNMQEYAAIIGLCSNVSATYRMFEQERNVSFCDEFTQTISDIIIGLYNLLAHPGVVYVDYSDMALIFKEKRASLFISTINTWGVGRAEMISIFFAGFYATNKLVTNSNCLISIQTAPNSLKLSEYNEIARGCSEIISLEMFKTGIVEDSKLSAEKLKVTLFAVYHEESCVYC